MPARSTPRIYDGTTGGSVHSGRRTHIIQILREAKEPLSVVQVAQMVGIHANTARFHLESLVDAGLATRETEVSDTPGRRRILYTGILPNQTHERSHGYRLLAHVLTGLIASKHPEKGDEMYQVGVQWGGYLTSRPAPFEVLTQKEIYQRVMDKLDALWFAPEFKDSPRPCMLMHNCPFLDLAQTAPQVVCMLHAGMINGSLAELHSTERVTELAPLAQPSLCYAFTEVVPEGQEPKVQLTLLTEEEQAAQAEENLEFDQAE